MKRDKFVTHYTAYLSKKKKEKFLFRLQCVIHEEIELHKERQRFISNFLKEHGINDKPINLVWDAGGFNVTSISLAEVLNKQNPNE